MSDDCLSLMGTGEGFSRERRDERMEREAKEESEVAEAAMAREIERREREAPMYSVSVLSYLYLYCY